MAIQAKHRDDPAFSGSRANEQGVGGMTCSGFVGRVQRAFSQEPGVSQAVIELSTGMATIGSVVGCDDPAALADAVRRLGYRVELESPASEGSGQ